MKAPTELSETSVKKHYDRILTGTLLKFFERFFENTDSSFNPNATIVRRPFPHPGNWSVFDQLVDVTVPETPQSKAISFTVRMKVGNLNDTFSRLRPDRTLSRALADENMSFRVRERLKQRGRALSRLTAKGTITPFPYGTMVGTTDPEELLFPPLREWKSVFQLDTGGLEDDGNEISIFLKSGKTFTAPPRKKWTYVLGLTAYTHGVEDCDAYINRTTEGRTLYIDGDDDDLLATAEVLKIVQAPYTGRDTEAVHTLTQRFIMGRVTSLVLNHPGLTTSERNEFCNDVRMGLESEDIASLPLCEASGDFKPANLLRVHDKSGRREPTDWQTAPEWTGVAHPALDAGYYFAHELQKFTRTGNPLFRVRAFRWFDFCESVLGVKNICERAARWGIPLAIVALFSPQFAGDYGLPKERPLFNELWRMVKEGTCGKLS